MRRTQTMVLLAISALGAGCGPPPSERQALLRAAREQCVEALAGRAAERPDAVPTGMDVEWICSCSTQRAAAGKTGAELRMLATMRTPANEQIEAIGACAVENARRAGVLAR